MRDRYLASQQPPAEATPGVWVRHPTVGDLVEIEERQGKPGFIGWYLVRFMCTSEGSPVFAPDETEKAERVHAAIATKVLEKVGQLMQSPPDVGQTGVARSGLEIRPNSNAGRRASRHRLDDLGSLAS